MALIPLLVKANNSSVDDSQLVWSYRSPIPSKPNVNDQNPLSWPAHLHHGWMTSYNGQTQLSNRVVESGEGNHLSFALPEIRIDYVDHVSKAKNGILPWLVYLKMEILCDTSINGFNRPPTNLVHLGVKLHTRQQSRLVATT
jgi:hypothetical protein